MRLTRLYVKIGLLFQELSKQHILANKEYQRLLATAQKIKKAGKKITNDRLISEMTFGFWVHLFTKTYRTRLWDKKGFFEHFLTM